MSKITHNIFAPLCFIVFTALLTFVSTNAQDDEIIKVNTNLLTVPVLVTDSKQRRIGNLTQEDFSLLDDGQKVPITHFSAGAEKVSLLFALDASGSVREIIEKERDAAVNLFRHFGTGSQISVLHFNDVISVAVPFTKDLKRAEKGFVIPAQANRKTAIFDAALSAITVFSLKDRDPTERKILILFSDGLDNLSRTKSQNVIEEANKTDVSIYILHLPIYMADGNELKLRKPSKGFRDLAEKTGGIYFILGDVQTSLLPNARYDLTKVFQTIEDDLKSQYIIGYYPEDLSNSNKTHKISVKLNAKAKQKLRVRLLKETFNMKGN